jgi:hypothetical protein
MRMITDSIPVGNALFRSRKMAEKADNSALVKRHRNAPRFIES